MDDHGPLRTLYYKLEKWNTLNYVDTAPLSILLLDPMPIKRILQPRERGGHPVGTPVS